MECFFVGKNIFTSSTDRPNLQFFDQFPPQAQDWNKFTTLIEYHSQTKLEFLKGKKPKIWPASKPISVSMFPKEQRKFILRCSARRWFTSDKIRQITNTQTTYNTEYCVKFAQIGTVLCMKSRQYQRKCETSVCVANWIYCVGETVCNLRPDHLFLLAQKLV